MTVKHTDFTITQTGPVTIVALQPDAFKTLDDYRQFKGALDSVIAGAKSHSNPTKLVIDASHFSLAEGSEIKYGQISGGLLQAYLVMRDNMVLALPKPDEDHPNISDAFAHAVQSNLKTAGIAVIYSLDDAVRVVTGQDARAPGRRP